MKKIIDRRSIVMKISERGWYVVGCVALCGVASYLDTHGQTGGLLWLGAFFFFLGAYD
tara:strand:- start:3222 stop:3395 length:174 start_codon:yes stop_codon:yes gene_type:complete